MKEALTSRLASRLDFVSAFLPAPNRPTPRLEFERGKERLAQIKATHFLGIPVKEAFSEKMHRRLASTAPPRSSIELSFQETCIRVGEMYDDLLRVLEAVGYDGGAAGLRTFLWSFAERRPQPLTFARAFLQTMTVGQNQIASVEEVAVLVEDDLRLAIPNGFPLLEQSYWLVERPEDARFKIARAVDAFYQQAAPLYTRVFQCLCQNRCRIRRSLVNVLQDFDTLLGSLQDAASQPAADSLQQARSSFARCIETQLLTIGSWTIQLALEQDLMQPHELPSSYWMLSRLLMQADMAYAEAANEEDYLASPPDRTPAEMARMFLAYDLATDLLSAKDELSSALHQVCLFLFSSIVCFDYRLTLGSDVRHPWPPGHSTILISPFNFLFDFYFYLYLYFLLSTLPAESKLQQSSSTVTMASPHATLSTITSLTQHTHPRTIPSRHTIIQHRLYHSANRKDKIYMYNSKRVLLGAPSFFSAR